MQLKRSILFLGQAALLHGLIVFYGFTASPSVEDESANDEMTTYAVDTLTPHAETTETPSSREPSTQTQTATAPPLHSSIRGNSILILSERWATRSLLT